MKRSAGMKVGISCCHPSRQHWKDFCHQEFQPYHHLDRMLVSCESSEPFRPNAVYSDLFHQHNGDRKSKYTCKVCQVDISSTRSFEPAIDLLQAHCETPSHQHCVNVIHEMKSSREKVFCAQMQRKMDALPPALWQMKVQRELFSWLLNEKANPSFPFYREHKATFFHLDLQERKEAQYLLELATWKALCIAASSIGNGVRDFTGWSAWQTEGWKALKASKRDSNEIGVIVKSVLPFLGTSLDAVGDLDIDAVRDEENDDEAYVGRMFYPSHFADYMLTDTLPDGEVNHSSVLMWGHSEMECDMCDILVGNGLEALEHQSDAEHVRRMQIIIDFQKCPIKMWCANIQNRLESSREREAPWTLEVFSKLYWFLLGYQSWSDDQVNARKDEIIHLLDTHERHEAMILLRLAVWKYACLLNPTSIQEASVKDKDYIAWADWGSQGWKRRKASTPRNSVEIDTIVKCVQPFLTEDRVV